jgi:hypothetical protein
MLLKITYSLSLLLSISLAYFLQDHLSICEEDAWGYIGEKNIELLIISSLLVKWIFVIIVTIDSILIVKRRIREPDIINLTLKWVLLVTSIGVLNLVFFNLWDLPGRCDRIIGPADTGLFLSMISILIISISRLIILKRA